MEEIEVTLYLTVDRARALARLAWRLDHEALHRLTLAHDFSLTIQGLHELQEALGDAGFLPVGLPPD